MLCKKPYFIHNMPFGCSQCTPCRLNRRRLWTHRLLLESFKHSESSFVTLTYAPEFLPEGNTLVPEDPKNWLKRLRFLVAPIRLRYFLVGEYGDETERPHYHVALFGLGEIGKELMAKAWRDPKTKKSLGHIMVGTLTKDSAQYVAGYVTKKMTSKEDPRLNGRYPEFARMSLRPGIGALAVDDIQSSLVSKHGLDFIKKNGDVPGELMVDKKKWPLGRYLKNKLREGFGLVGEIETISGKKKKICEASAREVQKYSKEMSLMLKDSRVKEKAAEKPLNKLVYEKNLQKIRNIESNAKIKRKKGTL